MTREEATIILFNQWQVFLEDNIDYAGVSDAYKMAIKTLKQDHCEDAISRQAVLDALDEWWDGKTENDDIYEMIKTLPPVTPQYTDAEIQKMQEMEQAEIQKAYELGKAETRQWIPVSERLPEEGEDVLTQAVFEDDIKMCVSSRVDYNYWTGWRTRYINIVAWMPLPEPFELESDGEK